MPLDRRAQSFLTPRLVLGLCIALFGLLLAIDRTTILDADRVLRFWPVALIATGGELSGLQRSHLMGLQASGTLDFDALRERVQSIETRLHNSIRELLVSQGVRLISGTARFKGPHEIVVDTGTGLQEIEADVVLVATGSRPRVPDWAPVDGERVLVSSPRGKVEMAVRVQPDLPEGLTFTTFHFPELVDANVLTNDAWLRPTSVLQPRFVKFSAQIDF